MISILDRLRGKGPRSRRAAFTPLELAEAGLAAAFGQRFARGGTGSLATSLPPDLVPDPEPRPGKELRGAGARRLLRAAASVLLGFHLLWIGTTSLLILSYRWVQPPVTVLMAYRAWANHWKIERPRPRPLRSTPLWLRSALISVEDYKFYSHFGLDFEAIQRAYEINSRLDEPLYGGSTLTMQVARTLFLVPEKSYVRKYLEVIVALELEILLGKDRILELYFGYAEWGKGLFGIEAAARRYYGVPAASLGRDQGARLIAILSSPIKYRPDWFGKSLILKERYAFLSRRLNPEAAQGSDPPMEVVGGGSAATSSPPAASPSTKVLPREAIPPPSPVAQPPREATPPAAATPAAATPAAATPPQATSTTP